MKHAALFLACLFILAPPCLAGQAPLSIGGISLGVPLNTVKDKLDIQSSLPIRYFESVTETVVKPLPGFKSGLVCHGSCAAPGLIVRLKFKYQDPSRVFFDQILLQYKKRFGEPGEWKGDAFGLIHAWKWTFTAQNGHAVSLILQHNEKAEDEKLGNAVKLTDMTLWDAERACFDKSRTDTPDAPLPENWDPLLPR